MTTQSAKFLFAEDPSLAQTSQAWCRGYSQYEVEAPSFDLFRPACQSGSDSTNQDFFEWQAGKIAKNSRITCPGQKLLVNLD